MHIRGDGETPIKDIKFTANVTINKEKVNSKIVLLYDSPTNKSFQINWLKTYPSEANIEIEMEYFWKKTWNLTSDFYSYDVLAWLNEIKYEFTLPKSIKIKTVESTIIDIFNREWGFYGETIINDCKFEWIGKNAPLFSTIILKYETDFQ